MQSTKDYSIFKDVDSNREVDPRHVARLARAISTKNLLHLNPIIVDADMRVIDGQHRMEAAKDLGVEIWYMVDEDISKSDISHLNSNKKNWTLIDYVNFYTVEKRRGFATLSKFIAEHPQIPVSSAIGLLNPYGRRNTKEVMEGYLDVSNIVQAGEIAEFLRWLRNHYEFAYNGSVISVIRQMYDNVNFDVEYLKEKILGQPRSLVKCVNARQYREMFLDIYNYKLSVNRLTLNI